MGKILPWSALMLSSFSVSASAYKLKEESWTYKPAPMGVPFTVCARGAPTGAVATIKKAALAWNYKKFSFSFGADKCLDRPKLTGIDKVNYIDFGDMTFAGRGSIAALTSAWVVSDPKRIDECDIRFNAAKKWQVGSSAPASDQQDLYSVALHEFGHCLGLSEGDVKGSVMDDVLLPGEMRRNLTTDDIAGRKAIYGE
jgi:hypothetical protein